MTTALSDTKKQRRESGVERGWGQAGGLRESSLGNPRRICRMGGKESAEGLEGGAGPDWSQGSFRGMAEKEDSTFQSWSPNYVTLPSSEAGVYALWNGENFVSARVSRV